MTASSLPEPAAGLPDLPECLWRIRLEVDESEARVAAAIDGCGTIIGLATAGVTRDDDVPTAWELYSINVVAHQRGSGLADDLLRVVATGKDTTVWVLTENARARSFYSRHGFRVEGATRAAEATGACETRMVRRSAES